MNFVGLVFFKEELDCIVDICNVNNVMFCLDEIYCDLIFEEGKQYIFVGCEVNFVDNSVMLMVVSKIFNIVGLGMLFVIIFNR